MMSNAIPKQLMEETLAFIAKQPLSTELDEHQYECADFEGGYDVLIENARDVLKARTK